LSRYYILAPFDAYLIFEIGSLIHSISFAGDSCGSPLTGSIRRAVEAAFENADVKKLPDELLDINIEARSYALYAFLRKTGAYELYAYSDVAYLVYGSRHYARAVANWLRLNRFAFFVPCHRVVAKHSLGGFSAGVELKRRILEWERNLATAGFR